MRRNFRAAGLLSCTALICGAATPALAQDENQADEIIVTAEKRETSLQKTPLSIQAFNSERLEAAGAASTLDLQMMSPGVVVSTDAATAQVYIRGVGTNFGGDQSVALHVDGVYQASTQAALQDFLDVERIEVLKGPQGTLYGRNATAGVVNIISKRPSMDFEFKGDVSYGNYDDFRQRAMVNVPISQDLAALRLSFVNADRDGFRRNPYLNTRIDDENHYGVRGQLLLTPASNIDILLSGDYSDEDDSRTLGFKVNKNVFAPQVDLLPTLGLPGGTVPDDPNVIYSDRRSIQHNNQYGGSLDVKIDFGSVTLNSLTAYRENRSRDDIDIDGTEVAYLNSDNPGAKKNWFSQELRLTSNSSGPLSWITGLYFLKESESTDGTYDLPILEQLGVVPGPVFRDAKQSGRSYAAFAQATYEVTDQINITAGARYSHEKKFTTIYVNADEDLGVAGRGKASWNAFTPKIGIDYTPGKDVMLYASVTKGFKAGGFSGLTRYQPEYIWSYEAGLRSTLLDGLLRVNATAFYYDYSDIQVKQILAAPDPATGSTVVIENAATATVKGLELELGLRPFSGFQINAYASVLDAKYGDYLSPNTEMPGNPIVDLTGNRLPRAPKMSAAVSAEYSWSVGSLGEASIQGNMYHQSRIYFTPFNSLNDPFGQQKDYQLFGARLGFKSADGRWNAAIFGKNLTNEVYKQNVMRALGFYGQLDILAPPRTYGVQFGVSF